jgi:hypothetical protein
MGRDGANHMTKSGRAERRRIDKTLRRVLGDRCHIFSVDPGVQLQIDAQLLLRRGQELVHEVPLTGLGIHSASRADLRALAGSAWLEGLAHLGIHRLSRDVTVDDLAGFLASLAEVQAIQVPSVGPKGASALATLSGLRSVTVGEHGPWQGVPLGPSGLHHICRVEGLRDLSVWGQNIGPHGWAALQDRSLRSLHIANDSMDTAPRLAGLERLGLNGVKGSGLTQLLTPDLLELHLTQSPVFDRRALSVLDGHGLNRLLLGGNVVDTARLAAVRLPQLDQLRLSLAHIGASGQAALAKATGIAPRQLDLWYVGEFGMGWRRVLESRFGERLKALSLVGFSHPGWVEVALARPLTTLELDEADYLPADLDRLLSHGGAQLEQLALDAAYGCGHDRVLAWAARAPRLRLRALAARGPGRADLLALAANPAIRCVQSISLTLAREFDDGVASAWATSRHLSATLELTVGGSACSEIGRRTLHRRFGDHVALR